MSSGLVTAEGILEAAGLPEEEVSAWRRVAPDWSGSFDVDTRAAQAVCDTDERVDAIHRQMYVNVERALREDPGRAERVIHLLSVSRQLERIADHATNIAEDVIYMAKGDIARHGGPSAEGA